MKLETIYPGRRALWELMQREAPESTSFFLELKAGFNAKLIGITFDKEVEAVQDEEHKMRGRRFSLRIEEGAGALRPAKTSPMEWRHNEPPGAPTIRAKGEREPGV